jgi:glycosyltransferase involved in cell wall biosynthesis
MTHQPLTNNGAATRIGFVVPRYGPEVVGGAEQLVRAFAEQLQARSYPVEVFTTCTNDMMEWNNHYEPGDAVVNGVPVHRFLIDQLDIGQIFRTAEKVGAGQPIPYSEQVEFVRQNINSQALYQRLRERQHEFAGFIFAPYLFGTTYAGIQAVPDKAILLPCLHDEPFAYFAIYRELLEQVRGVIFNAEAERRFAVERLGMINRSTAVVGYGFDPATPAGDPARFRAQHNLPPELVFYTGRVQGGKNVHTLVDYFVQYKTERPGPLTLLICGDGDVLQIARPDVVQIGFLSREELPDAYAAATVFCQPSLNESFSIVIMESWLQGAPVLVHGNCAVTSEHVERSGGGWTFRDYAEFRAALDQALGDQAARDERGRAGRAYVLREYNWETVVARLLDALAAFARPSGLYEQLSRRGVRRALDFSRERFEDQLAQVIARAEADLSQGLTPSQIDLLRNAAQVGMPEYQVQSSAPIVGRLIAWLRRNLTSHLREPYIDPIVAKQEDYNKLLLDTLLPALERSQRTQRRLERQVRLLEQQLTELRAGQSVAQERAPLDDKAPRQ